MSGSSGALGRLPTQQQQSPSPCLLHRPSAPNVVVPRRPVAARHLPQRDSRHIELISREPPNRQVVCGQQGPPPPSPIVVERFQQVISQLFQQRIVRVGGPIDDDMANLVVAQLLYLDSAGKEDITMYVNSPGGSVTAGMAVFDTMRHVRPHVSTACIGLAASMGAFILASGQQGKRYSLPNSRIMIHQPLGGAQGQAAGASTALS
ncbi:hypothetical protein WJX73_007381 [Symbiochloris irregularis]|uniref:ATP-dependent Clp protease proteolytic subunit n=1 Tax=Symbiochloris irregularis TaxID=706552 RepID=A0AAW1NQK1_9CHLO